MAEKLLSMGTLLLVAGLLAACGGPAATQTGVADDAEATEAVVEPAGWRELQREAGGAVVAEAVVEPLRWSDLRFEVAGDVAEVTVQEGDVVSAGDVLARLETADLLRAVTQAELSLRQAQLRLEQLQQPPDEADIRQAEHVVDQAAAAIEVAELNVATVLDSTVLNETLQDAQMVFEEARHRYEYALQQYDLGEMDYYFVDLEQQRYEEARLGLSRIQQQGDLRLQNARNDLDRAQQAYQEAQDGLERLLGGPDPQDVESAQLDIEAAELSLEEARNNLEGAALVAPFDGVVAAIYVDAGDAVATGEVALVLATLDQLRVRTADLTQLDVLRVAKGQPATVTVDALPGQEFAGVVREVALRPGDNAGDVVYAVTVELIDSELVTELRWGMTAVVEITTTP